MSTSLKDSVTSFSFADVICEDISTVKHHWQASRQKGGQKNRELLHAAQITRAFSRITLGNELITDESLTWQQIHFDHHQLGQHFGVLIFLSLSTSHRTDRVYHMPCSS